MQPKHILVVEDERDLAEMIQYNLRRKGYHVNVAHDGVTAASLIRNGGLDLVILDLMLPGQSGMEVARQARIDPASAGVPILMLTARAEEADQIAGLTAGADDYVTKPFAMPVLLARVDALLRRAGEAARSTQASGTSVRFGPIEAELSSHRLLVDGGEIKPTLTEFKLLVALLQTPQKVLSRNELITRVMGPGIVVTARTIDVHIAAIRRKLGDHGNMIRTVRGVGYQLVLPQDAPATADE